MRDFLWLLPMGMMPGAAVMWGLIAPLQLRLTQDRSVLLKSLAAVGSLVVFVLLAGFVVAAPYREILPPGDFVEAVRANAYALFGIAIPWAAITAVSVADRKLKWWQAVSPSARTT